MYSDIEFKAVVEHVSIVEKFVLFEPVIDQILIFQFNYISEGKHSVKTVMRLTIEIRRPDSAKALVLLFSIDASLFLDMYPSCKFSDIIINL